mgnify:CR=1 FL=1
MIRFLLKGLMRDRHRSLMPFIVTSSGVMLTVVFHAWINGVIHNSIEFNARFSTGHAKITTRAYSENATQSPNDLAILGSDTLMGILTSLVPEMEFAQRIYFSGLIDVPDRSGETVTQGPTIGIGIDLLSENTEEPERLNIPLSLKTGHLPEKSREALLSNSFAAELGVNPGDTITLVGSNIYGAIVLFNFILCGTVEFGTTALDRGTIIADIQDVRHALNMSGAAGEILGFFRTGLYNDQEAKTITSRFNQKFYSEDDEFSLVMKRLPEMNNMDFLVEYSDKLEGILVAVFIFAMSLILWNAGLLGGLRRYGEFGMRLAIGEEKSHIFKTMMMESFLISLFGSAAGILAGITVAFYLQNKGIDLGFIMKNASIMMPRVFRAQITPQTWYIGLIPGFISTQIGTLLAGRGIYKRQTSQLFKEFEG